jgi:predicted amidophosphoribosyltransferase
MGIAILSLFAIALVAGVLRMFSGLGSIRMGHATLKCPFCGKETPANRAACEHCEAELR